MRPRWPRKMVIDELFINDNGLRNHVHIASRERKKLIRLAKIAADRYGEQYVREFPPFDKVDCVHTPTSFHYRDSSNPDQPRDCAHRGNGLAFDLGAAKREEFAHDVKRRYRPRQCDF